MGRQRRARAPTRDPWIREVERTIGRRFRNPALLRSALTHPSVGGEGRTFERLEFLGDAILTLLVALHLYRRHPALPPGQLTRLRADVVNRAALAEAATQLGFPALLRLGRGEDPGGRRRPTILAATFEAVVGALLLDGGLAHVTKFLAQHLYPLVHPVTSPDPKSALQIILQDALKTLPRYRLLEVAGPPHARRFLVEVELRGQALGRGTGKSRRDAERAAARAAVEMLQENPHILRSFQG